MSKYKSFEELKQARLKAYNGMVEGDVLGFLDQHTGFYPDPAHFIYELLQNAEDMSASEVQFRLFDDRLVFEHNGTKRDFNLNDIDAITNKGKSPKADDPTQIGKFGMGFKAVYVYTNTPEIHSGEYDFRIENIIVPNDENVPKLAQKGFTQFIFPFDNPKITPENACKEIIEEGFEKLDETALLFLTHIETIRYCLPDGSEGAISIKSKVLNIKFLYQITVKKPEEDCVVTYWARFSDDCPLMVKNKDSNEMAIKMFPVSVAFRLIRNEFDGFTIDSSLIGKVCLFFPTEMESLLHFHINAPFASTVARDVILSKGEDGESNKKLISKLAELTVESLHWFKKAKMLDYNAYTALPTLRDFNNRSDSRFIVFAEKIIHEFKSKALFITEDGTYEELSNIMWASTNMKKIIPFSYAFTLFEHKYIPTYAPTTRIEAFLKQFSIEELTIEDCIECLEKNYSFFDDLWNKQTNSEYFKTLYDLLNDAKDRQYYESLSYGLSPGFNELRKNTILKKVAFIKCEDGKLHKPSDQIYLRTEYIPKVNLKDPVYVDLELKNNQTDRNIKSFLINLGVKEMTEKEDISAFVSQDGSLNCDDTVDALMRVMANFDNGDSIEEYVSLPLFIALNQEGKECPVCASSICLPSVEFFYRNSNVIKYILDMDLYTKCFNDSEMNTFMKVFKALGGNIQPKIRLSNIKDNAKWSYASAGGVERETCINIDFSLPDSAELEEIGRRELFDECLILWDFLRKFDGEALNNLYTGQSWTYKWELERLGTPLKAYYCANRSAIPVKLDSTLCQILRKSNWIPNKNGEFKRPFEIKPEELHDGLEFNNEKILIELGLGDRSKSPENLVATLESSGAKLSETDRELLALFGGMSEEEKKELIAKRKEDQKRREKMSFNQALSAENRGQRDYEEDDDFEPNHRVKNPTSREKKLEEDFKAGLVEIVKPSLKWHYTYSHTVNPQEKEFVKNQYHGGCQICNRPPIRKANGAIYFEAVNIIQTSNLEDKLLNNLEAGWNTLSLCPHCAARYRYSQKDINNLKSQVESIVIGAEDQVFYIAIQLENAEEKIRFTPKHLIALKAAFAVFKDE